VRFYAFFLGTLGVWRVTHLLHAEDGPGDVLLRGRQKLRGRFLKGLAGCFYCLSLWIAIPFAFVVAGFNEAGWRETLLIWPALSAGAIVIEQLMTLRDRSVTYYEDPPEERKEH
jgi:hypothetical protein